VYFTLGVGVAVWATKVEGLTTPPLLAGTEVLLDPAEGPVDPVGMVLPAGGQDSVLPVAVVVLVGIAVIEGISNERAQVVSTTGTPNGHDIRFYWTPSRGYVSGWYDSHFPFSLSLLAFFCHVYGSRKYSRAITGCGLSIRQVCTRVVYFIFVCFIFYSVLGTSAVRIFEL
jgi:hypothetical protein